MPTHATSPMHNTRTIAAHCTARQNDRLREWLADNGVWMTDKSGWGVPPHPLGECWVVYMKAREEDARMRPP